MGSLSVAFISLFIMKLNQLLHSNSEDFASPVKFEFKTHLRVKSNTRRNVLLIKVRVIPKVVHVVYVEEILEVLSVENPTFQNGKL